MDQAFPKVGMGVSLAGHCPLVRVHGPSQDVQIPVNLVELFFCLNQLESYPAFVVTNPDWRSSG